MKNKGIGCFWMGYKILSGMAACCILLCMTFFMSGCHTEEEQTGAAELWQEEETEMVGSRQEGETETTEPRQEEELNTAPAADSMQEFPTDAWEAAEQMGVGINLGNTMEAYWEDTTNLTSGAQKIGSNTPGNYETCWGAVETTEEMINGMKEAGFSTLRIPVYWGNMMADDGTFTINQEYLGRVEELVTYGLDADMYVVINIHHYDQFLIEHYPQDQVLEITEGLWKQIAGYFREYPEELIFEGFNEALGMTGPEGQLDAERMYAFVNDMNQTFVDAVRGTGGGNAARILIVSGYNTNIDATTDERFRMPEDTVEDRLMVSVHYVDNNFFWTNSIGNEAWLDYSRSQCELLKARFLDQGIPVFVGECTAGYPPERISWDATVTESADCLETILGMIAEYGMVPVLWDVCDQFYLRSEQRIASEKDQAVIEAYHQ
ncbi:MAG: glycoside hydrolase family 5 protein [Lachnospiraceae bacterium]|nr:glycoside hydrolase family 5 protein [Lachnospiraceae bacterium]